MSPEGGRLIALEGIDGVGKSSLQRRLAGKLKKAGLKVRLWAEPSQTELGRAARRSGGADPFSSAMLFTLDRAAQRPRLEALLAGGATVLSDRSMYSTLAYQGSMLGARARRDLDRLQRQVAHPPDLVLWLDLPATEALRRVSGRGQRREAFERLKTLTRTATHYRQLARHEPDRFVRLDASLPAEELAEAALAAVLRGASRAGRGRRREGHMSRRRAGTKRAP